ncbi:hypothetical protein ARMA_2759 [Ardenticatena maritima]|uniref:Uncharacterized protein n=1 Tax=Ardenticatena maritima TaxID=872965 RepID=A0A0M8KBR4_9CHLR|nr:hypothetical protein ARMA_2759 [Ardenticatena maritima]
MLPNPAFSGRGCAAGQRGRHFGRCWLRQQWWKDGDAAPLTLSLAAHPLVL